MEALAAKEKESRAKVFELTARGQEATAAALRDWGEARRVCAAALERLPGEEAQIFLGAKLKVVESQLARLEESGRISRDEAFGSVVELGESLRWILWMADYLGQELTMDPLSLMEQELRRVEIRSENLMRLDLRLQRSTQELARRIRKEQQSLLQCRLGRFVLDRSAGEAAGPLDEASEHWLAAAEAFQIETDTPEHLAGGAHQPAGARGLDQLRATREAHLEACAEELARANPEEAAEFVESSVADLLEEASGGLSEGESSEPVQRIRALNLMVERIDSFTRVLGDWRVELGRRGSLGDEDRRQFRSGVRQLSKARRQVLNARVEVRVQKKLEDSFGRRKVRLFENLIMVLIFGLLGLVFAEWRVGLDLPALAASGEGGAASRFFWGIVSAEAVKFFHIADIVFCIFFQVDFVTRWAFSRWNGSYFLRHFFFESLPAVPYGFVFAQLGGVEEARAVILLRILRLRGVLTLRALVLVVVRVFRIVIFFMRGVDRAVEKFRHVFDRDVVIFDTDPLQDAPESPLRRRVMALENRRQRFLRNFYGDLPWGERGELLRRHALQLGAESRMAASLALPYRRGVARGRGEIRIERVIYNFLDCDVTRAISMVGKDGVERIARWLRFLDIPVFRQAPIIRRLVPAGRMINPAEAVSFAVNAAGQVLQELLGVLRFWADLSGITTGPQILDRVGTGFVAASRRPAMRLILIGSLFIVAEGMSSVLGRGGLLSMVAEKLFRILGLPILLLGSICLLFLMLGLWFKKISGEALDQYLRTSDAHFYPLIKARKFLNFTTDMELLYRSVLRSECRLRCAMEIDDSAWIEFLGEPIRERARFMPGRMATPGHPFDEFAEDREMIVLLYRDFLDSPVLHRTDDKASVQLLGNLSIQNIRLQTLGVGAKELRKLERLVLEKGSILALGPYLWFRFITESLAIETAKLIAEYNSTCMPKAQLHLASPQARRRFEEFLEDHKDDSRASWRRTSRARERRCGETLSNASFTAFDFLGPTEESDEAVRQRYGDQVLAALKQDRRAVIRDVFGTRPYHLLPRHQRVLNPYRLYRRYLGGAKFFFLPAILVFALLRLNMAGVAQLRELVDEVLGKKRTRRSQLSRFAGFDVAVRKINRMRKPLFMEALRLRAAVDVEYLGLRIPGQKRDEETVTCDEHLDFIGALDAERRPLVKLRSRAVRDFRRFRIFLNALGWRREGLERLLAELDPSGQMLAHKAEVMRALVTAYVTDHGSLRSILTAPEWARTFFEKVLRAEKRTATDIAADFIASKTYFFLSRHRRRRRMFREFVRLDEALRGLEPRVRRCVLARLLRADNHTERMLDFALRNLRREAEVGEDAVVEALKRAACDYKLWTRKLITVRAVQALMVLDVRNYRDMVWEVGEYSKDEKVELEA